MLFKNKKVAAPTPLKFVVYREDENGQPANIEFICEAVLNFDEFEKACPEPKKPVETIVGTNEQRTIEDDRQYKLTHAKWEERRGNYMNLKSIINTPGLTLETVKMDDSSTWDNLDKELQSVLTFSELNRLYAKIWEASTPTSNRRKEALQTFTPGDQAQSSGQ